MTLHHTQVDRQAPGDLVEKRRKLTRAEIIEITVRQAGRCGCGCGHRLDPFSEGVIDEHIIPLELTGSNDITNRALYRKPCAAEKTKADATDIAKAKRRAGETCQGAKRPIPPRGFDKTRTKRFDGTVVPRVVKASTLTDGGVE